MQKKAAATKRDKTNDSVNVANDTNYQITRQKKKKTKKKEEKYEDLFQNKLDE